MVGRLIYFTKKALASIKESPGVSLLTVATIAAALTVLGAYTMGITNLESLALVWGRTASVSAYIADSVPENEWQALRDSAAKVKGVEQAVLVRPKDALERFKARGEDAAALVAGVEESVLPATIELTVAPGFTDLTTIERLARELKGMAGIADVDYGREEFERLRGLLDLLRYGGIIGGLLIALATAFIVSNTIRLAVYARQDEIGILRLVGATGWFIRAPFVIEGALWGLGGATAAIAILWLSDRFAAPRLASAVAEILGGLPLRLFAAEVGLGVLAGGILLGAVGSFLAVRRFLEAEL